MDNKISFKSASLYNATARVQENTLLNRGILELGGVAAPQVAMSNNKDEAIERMIGSGLFFSISFLTPFILLPAFNKFFLKKAGIVNDFKGLERKIIEVSKKYLSQDADTMVKGIKETAKKLDIEKSETSNEHQKAFEQLLQRFPDKEELRKKLLNVHKNVYSSDFLSTAWMQMLAPWVYIAITELRTNKKGFSAAFEMKETKIDDETYKKQKRNKLIANALFSTIPALVVPRLVTKAMSKDFTKLLKSENILKQGYGKFLNSIKKNAGAFDYTRGIYMSKTIFALMWLLSDYPNCIISSRDKHESKDRAIRYGVMNLMFFCGDFFINNVLGRLSDKFVRTKIMRTDNPAKNKGFFNRFRLPMNKFEDIKKLKGLDTKTLNKTKNMAAGIYWASLGINMALLGFGLPAFLNRMLKNDIKKEINSENQTKTYTQPVLDKKSFKQFGF